MSMSTDRVSQLPDELLSHILSFLPPIDANLTKFLSRRWRRVEVPLSSLYFNQYTIFGRIKEEYEFKQRCEFVNWVDQFLKFHKGPYLNTFQVRFWLNNEFSCHIDKWIAWAVGLMEAESIHLNFSSLGQEDHLESSASHYCFPFHLVLGQCESPPRLKNLHLNSCSLMLRPRDPPPPHVFSSLKTLWLKDIDLNFVDKTSSVLETLDAWLELDWLILEDCKFPTTACISGRFKGLCIRDCPYPVPDVIELLDCVNLETFELQNDLFIFLSFRGVPALKSIHLGRFCYEYRKSVDFVFHHLSELFPQLQALSLTFPSHDYIGIPASVTTFSCLKQLELIINFESLKFHDYLSVGYLLNACPMLNKFRLALEYDYGPLYIPSPEPLRKKQRSGPPVYYLQLEEIEISGFQGTFEEAELIIYMLNKAVALERLILVYPKKKFNQDQVHDSLKVISMIIPKLQIKLTY